MAVANDRDVVRAGRQSVAEEIANAVTHGAGAILSVVALILMVLLAAVTKTPWAVVAVGVFGGALVLLYLVSALYHGVPYAGPKRILRLLDHCTVFILIAGTYTPIALLALDGGPHWVLLGAVWGLALFGVCFCIICRERFEWVRVTLCVAMGWLALAWMGPLVDGVGWAGSGLLLAGGVAYTAGIVFYAWESLPYNHAIWHMFVLGGSTAHFLAILFFVI